ncbi:uncharacterized protein LOC34618095 [Cyclospora cayetanensis]|uniref:Uncharacterized protein LOC34618095 n=1 Tax=Cyclospora cayetanensis TaxID=88456 RepID=A0A6P6RSE0_9EIME|nr:uncharacterized protein LOC34618095 [Cyclospora cayetanensis]
MDEDKVESRQMGPRPSVLNVGGQFSTIVLVDVNGRPTMNLHRVPQHVCVGDVKNKISERLLEVGRNLPPDLIILNYGENADIEMENSAPLNKYNTMGLSKIQVQIVKRHKAEINVVVIKPEKQCLCIKTSSREELPFQVLVPGSCYIKQLRMEIARRMNCNIDRHSLELFYDPNLQMHVIVEGTCRASGIVHGCTVYMKLYPNFDVNNLAPLEAPRTPAAGSGDKKQGDEAAEGEQKGEEGLLTESTEAEEVKEAPKSALQLDFEKKAGKSLAMPVTQAAEFARKLGYSPAQSDLVGLPGQVDYKGFQTFLTCSLHAEDLAESFQEFFSTFDIQATGDLTAKQLCNIVQMYGDEPLSKAEAEKFTKIIMQGHSAMPIRVVVDRIMEGQI